MFEELILNLKLHQVYQIGLTSYPKISLKKNHTIT